MEPGLQHSRVLPESVSVAQEHLRQLQVYRRRTETAVAAVRAREVALRALFVAVQVRAARSSCTALQAWPLLFSWVRMSWTLALQDMAAVAPVRGAAGGAAAASAPAERRPLRHMLSALHSASVAVVHEILAWRECFWRPHGFRWEGESYLLKVRECNRCTAATSGPKARIAADVGGPDRCVKMQRK